jgi:lipoate-protein ligase A
VVVLDEGSLGFSVILSRRTEARIFTDRTFNEIYADGVRSLKIFRLKSIWQ